MGDREELLSWFDRQRRDLPWRRTRDPYRIWLSEVMLQQTRVETVIPYYEKFLARFPSLESLAGADLSEVLAHWSGLGYYRRARQLHAAALAVRDRHGGEMPQSVAGLESLPGVGSYTAAAVASIAFGVAVPVLDGNVERVLTRRLALAGNPKSRAVRALLLEEGARLLDTQRPGDANQALMEIGATVCAPQRPRCLFCPLLAGCRAAAEGQPERYPAKGQKRESERVDLVAAVVARGSKVLLFRRPDDSTLLAGTWEVPWAQVRPGEELEPALARRYGGRWTLGVELGKVRHGITFRDLHVEVRQAEMGAGDRVSEGVEAGWFDEAEREGLPKSSLVGKVLGKNYQP